MCEGEGMVLPIDTLGGNGFDEGFSGNRLLATLAPTERSLLEPHMTLVELALGDSVLSAGSPVSQSIFPFDSLVVSLMVDLKGGRSVEVASIGKEGAVGGIVSCGSAPAFTNAVVQIGGPAIAIPMHTLELAKQASKHLEHLFCRYSDYLLSQVMQSAACNSFHPIEARAARWLLHAQDRVGGDRIALTQESLAGLLGVQRTTVNAVARVLQDQGLIAYRRGAIQVVDRPGLMKAACECYASIEGHFAAVLGQDGRGGSMSDCA
jgi:CRP-like cAMP-binding protein